MGNENRIQYIPGRYLLDETIWQDAGIYITGYEIKFPSSIVLDENKVVNIVDDFLKKMMKK